MSDKRARCETEPPEDSHQSTNGSMEAKKLKTANDEAGSSKRLRPPRNVMEEQELNRLDQKEYDEIFKNLKRPPGVLNLEFEARKKFWEKFYAKSAADTYPEDQAGILNSRGRKIVAERRKYCPWYLWGLEGYTRDSYPQGWKKSHKDGDEGDASLDSPLFFSPSANSSRANRAMDKTGSFDLPLNQLEKAIKENEKEISGAISMRGRKRAESQAMRAKAVDFKTKSAKFNQKIVEFTAKFAESTKEARKLDSEADKLDAEVAKSDETLKQKQPLLDVQRLVLAARKANDSYGN